MSEQEKGPHVKSRHASISVQHHSTRHRVGPRQAATASLSPSVHPLTRLQSLAGNRAVQHFVAATRAPTVQKFDTDEHLKIGDRGTDRSKAQMVTLAPDYQITYGEMIAMAGDYFGSLEQMRELAKSNGTGPGTRAEIEYVRVVEVRKEAGQFDDATKKAAKRRYYDLALGNRSHFVNPEHDDPTRSTDAKAGGAQRELRIQWNGLFPRFASELVVPRAGAGYRHYHLQALFEAYMAGFDRRGMDEALAAEAIGAHYLTDAFSGGHLRTARASISEHWNPKVPMFTANVKGFIAQALAMRIGDAETWVSREMAYQGAFGRAGTLEQVSATLDEKGSFSFGDVVSGAIHDYESERGVVAEVDGRRETLLGDDKLGGRTEDLVVDAVNMSHNDVTRAWLLGQRRSGLEEVLSGATADGLVGAERMLPTVVPDSELPASQQSVKWDFPTADALLDQKPFQTALAEFGRRKASELAAIDGGLPDIAKPHFAPAVVEPFRNAPTETVRRILHWTPDAGGGLFGHNQDDNALDYYDQARAADAIESLTVEQRTRLTRDLLDGYTAGDEEDAIFDILTANPAHSNAVIAAVGWSRLEDELGNRFSRWFPEASHR